MYATDRDIAFYLLAKAGCYICGKGSNVVSTGVFIEGEGLLALCEAHICDLANFAGYQLNDPAHEARWQEKLDRETALVEEYRHEAAIQNEQARLAREQFEQYRTFVLDTFGERAPEVKPVEQPKTLIDPVTRKFVKR